MFASLSQYQSYSYINQDVAAVLLGKKLPVMKWALEASREVAGPGFQMHRSKFAAWQGNVEKLKARLQALIEAWSVQGRRGTYLVVLHCIALATANPILRHSSTPLDVVCELTRKFTPHDSCVRESNCIEIAQTLRVYVVAEVTHSAPHNFGKHCLDETGSTLQPKLFQRSIHSNLAILRFMTWAPQ